MEVKRIRNMYRTSLTDAIIRLEEMDASCLSPVYCALAFGEPALVKRGGRAVRRMLENFTMQQMIRLSENFRQYTSMEWSIDWKEIDIRSMKGWFESEKDYVYALILGSFHPNGYYREACLGEMSACEGTLPYMVLRLNDWVEPVRLLAFRSAMDRLGDCPLKELFAAMMALDKVKASGRRDGGKLAEIEQIIGERLEHGAADLEPESILTMEYAVRKCIYRYLMSGVRLERQTVEMLLARERHSFCQRLMISGLLAHYDCPAQIVEGYMRHPSACVRRRAMEYQYAVLGRSWDGIENMLLDASHTIRDMAAYILRKHSDVDIPAFYREHLSDGSPVTAILGIGEQGDRSMADLITPFLSHEDGRVVKSALEALGHLMGAAGEEIFWNSLFDPRATVSKASYLCIRKNGIRYGAGILDERQKQQAVSAGAPHVRRYLIQLLLQEPSWERLPYLIGLYGDPSVEELKEKILGAIGTRSLYTRISRNQADIIRQALDETGTELPEKLAEDIRFDMKFVVS